MFAPAGVDSDSSGETPTPPASASPRPPQFSFKSLIPTLPTRKKKIRTAGGEELTKPEAVEKLKKLTPVEAAEEFGGPRGRDQAKGKTKKKVRIVVEGEEGDADDETGNDLGEDEAMAENTLKVGQQESIESMVKSVSQSSHGDSKDGRRPEEAADEVLRVLRQLMAESAVARRGPGDDREDEDPNTAPISPYRSPASRFGKLLKLSNPPSTLKQANQRRNQNADIATQKPKPLGEISTKSHADANKKQNEPKHGAAVEYYRSFGDKDLANKLVAQNPTDEASFEASLGNQTGSLTPLESPPSVSANRSPLDTRDPRFQSGHHSDRIPQPWSAPPHPAHQFHPQPFEHVSGYWCLPSGTHPANVTSTLTYPHTESWTHAASQPPYNPGRQHVQYQPDSYRYRPPLDSYINTQISPRYHPGQFNSALWHRFQQEQLNIASNIDVRLQDMDRIAQSKQSRQVHPPATTHTYTPDYYPTYSSANTSARQIQHGYTIVPLNIHPEDSLNPPLHQGPDQQFTPQNDWSPSSLTNPRPNTAHLLDEKTSKDSTELPSPSTGLQVRVSPIDPHMTDTTSPGKVPDRMPDQKDSGSDEGKVLAMRSEKEPLRSPRIVMKGLNGWKEVESKVNRKDEASLPNPYKIRQRGRKESVQPSAAEVGLPENVKSKVRHARTEPVIGDGRHLKLTTTDRATAVGDDGHYDHQPADAEVQPSNNKEKGGQSQQVDMSSEPSGGITSRDERYAAEFKLRKMEYLRREKEKEKEKTKAKGRAVGSEAAAMNAGERDKGATALQARESAPFDLAEPLPFQSMPLRTHEMEDWNEFKSKTTLVPLPSVKKKGNGKAESSTKHENHVEEYKMRKLEELKREKKRVMTAAEAADGSQSLDDIDLAVRLARRERDKQSQRSRKVYHGTSKVRDREGEGDDEVLRETQTRHVEPITEKGKIRQKMGDTGRKELVHPGDEKIVTEENQKLRGIDVSPKLDDSGKAEEKEQSAIRRAERKLQLLAAQEAERIRLQSFARHNEAAGRMSRQERHIEESEFSTGTALAKDFERQKTKEQRVNQFDQSRKLHEPPSHYERSRRADDGRKAVTETDSVKAEKLQRADISPNNMSSSTEPALIPGRSRPREIEDLGAKAKIDDHKPSKKLEISTQNIEDEPLDMDILEEVLAEDEAKHRTWIEAKKKEISSSTDPGGHTTAGLRPERVGGPINPEKEDQSLRKEEEGTHLEKQKAESVKKASSKRPVPSDSTLPSAQFAALHPPSAHLPLSTSETSHPEQHRLSGHITWSRTLISLATCIDLANEVLSELMASESKGKPRNSPHSSILVQVLPRLLTGLLMQRDLVTSMKGAFGEEHSQSMDEFARHLNVIQTFLADKKHIGAHQGGTEKLGREDEGLKAMNKDSSQAFQLGSIRAVVGYLLHFSRYLTPQMVSSLKSILEEWHREGFSIKSVIHIITTLQHDLRSVSSRSDLDGSPSPSKSTHIGEIPSILEQLLSPLSFDRRHQIPSSPSETHKSISPSNQQNETTTAVPERKTSVPCQTPTDKMRTSGNGQSHGMRERVANVIHQVGDKLERNTTKSPGNNRLRVISEDEDVDPASSRMTSDFLRESNDHRAVKKQPLCEHRLHLPTATEEFLGHSPPSDDKDLRTDRAHQGGKHDSIIVTPPGPAFDADPKGQAQHAHRRPSAWSSDSHYSDDDSSGTAESDDEAREMLAVADSGPAPAEESADNGDSTEKPSEEQVNKAKELLLKPSPSRLGRAGRLVVIDEDSEIV